MRFLESRLKGAFIIEPEPIEDERGFFARTFCRREFEARGINPDMVQCSLSFSRKKGTLRGMHFQAPPNVEAKLVRCTGGAIYDAIIDLRELSPTFKQWIAAELTAENRRMLYIPEGFAHGFQTLVDDTEVFYQMSEYFAPQSARGLRWNDPSFAIRWPQPPTEISQIDREYQLFEDQSHRTAR